VTVGRWRSHMTLLGAVLASGWPSIAGADVKACLDAAEDGQKLRDSGAYRGARDRFIACAADECPGEVRKGCVGWLAELDTLIPTVVFGARAHGKEVSDVRVSVDGEAVAERIDGKPVVLDPGEHHFRFERTGEIAVDETAVVMAGEKQRLMTVRFGTEPQVVPPPQAATSSGTDETKKLTAARGVGSARATALALGAVGLACLTAGAALDLSGYVFVQQCSGDPTCTGNHERAEAKWRFVAGDILLGVGILSSAAALWLWPPGGHGKSHPVALIGVDPFAGRATLGWMAAF
jgi:hypothetical protein